MTQAAPEPRSPWHAGERSMHQRLGISAQMEQQGRRTIRDFMPDQHRVFYTQLPFLLVGAVDAAGAPWVTMLQGEPGFVTSPDKTTLRVAARPGTGDPVGAALAAGSAVGILGIELHSRRRNRINGTVVRGDGEGFTVTVGQAFGNCPQYIQTRRVALSRPPHPHSDAPVERATALDAAAIAMIAAADTFFVTSYAEPDGDPGQRAVDTSHRGGRPGFVRIDGNVLTIPDFAGNLYFNTLGNLLLNPRAGLLFCDFTSGDVLQLTGTTELVFAGAELSSFQGAERLWRFKVGELVRRRGALALRGTLGEYSPNSLLTGSWEEAAARQSAEALRHLWRPFRVARIVTESTTIRSFHLEPEDAAGLPLFRAGQHLPIRLRLSPSGAPVIRTYTLSVAPSDAGFRISVKRDGAVSQHLHDRTAVGDRIEARAPAGEFVVDAAEPRPLVLLSAGVGITPMLAMLRHVVYEGLRTRGLRKTWFFHGSRTKAEQPFDAELKELVRLGQGEVTVVRALSQPEPSAKKGTDYELQGRVEVPLLKAVLPLDDYDFYLCGPASFTQGVYDGLRALRIPDDRIFAEAFGPSTLVRRPDRGVTAPELTAAAAKPVRVVFGQSAKEATWTPGAGTLLDLAEAQGLSPEFSCRGGTCGTCRVRVRQGEVTYLSRPTAATDKTTALICCGVPAAADDPEGRLVLDL